MVADATRDDDSFAIPAQPQHSITRRADSSRRSFPGGRSFGGGGSEGGSATKAAQLSTFSRR